MEPSSLLWLSAFVLYLGRPLFVCLADKTSQNVTISPDFTFTELVIIMYVKANPLHLKLSKAKLNNQNWSSMKWLVPIESRSWSSHCDGRFFHFWITMDLTVLWRLEITDNGEIRLK